MNASNTSIKRYVLEYDEFVRSVDCGINMGIRVFHLSSGENTVLEEKLLCKMITYIKEKGCKVILVVGNKPYRILEQYKNTGADTFISKFETSNSWLYNEYNNKNGNLELRLNYLKKLRDIGFLIGTGNIIGLPFQRDSVLLNDLLLLKKINPSQASTSRFVSSKYSAYSNFESGSINKTKNFIALMRIMLNDETIIPTNSSIGKVEKYEMLLGGANLLSINLTPDDKYKNYVIYNDETRCKLIVSEYIERLNEMGLELEYIF